MLQSKPQYKLKDEIKLYHGVVNTPMGFDLSSSYYFTQELKQVYHTTSTGRDVTLHVFNNSNKPVLASLLGYSPKQFTGRVNKAISLGFITKDSTGQYRIVSISKINNHLNFKKYQRKKHRGIERLNIHPYDKIPFEKGIDLQSTYIYKLMQQQAERRVFKSTENNCTNVELERMFKPIKREWNTIDISMARIAEHLNLSPMYMHKKIKEMSKSKSGLDVKTNKILIKTKNKAETDFYLSEGNKHNKGKYHLTSTGDVEERNCNTYKIHSFKIPMFLKNGVVKPKVKPVLTNKETATTVITSPPMTVLVTTDVNTGLQKFEDMLSSHDNRYKLHEAGALSFSRAALTKKGELPKINPNEYSGIIRSILCSEVKDIFLSKFKNHLWVENSEKKDFVTGWEYTLSNFELVNRGNYDKAHLYLSKPNFKQLIGDEGGVIQ